MDLESLEDMISTAVLTARPLNAALLNRLREEKIRKEKAASVCGLGGGSFALQGALFD